MKVAARFKDGEIICGYTDHYTPELQGFFLLPASSNSNNRRAYVFTHATDKVKTGTEAELMVRQLFGPQAA